MEDYQIVDLYWDRKETAITETDKKYGKMLRSLSYSLLSSREDAEECVNDTYLGAWNTMPDARPMYLGPFLSKITRRISIDRWRHEHRGKRGGVNSIVEELTECIPDEETPCNRISARSFARRTQRILAYAHRGETRHVCAPLLLCTTGWSYRQRNGDRRSQSEGHSASLARATKT